MNFLQKKGTLVVFMIFCLSSWVYSQIVPVHQRAQGRSLVGSHLVNDSIYVNPAGGSFLKAYSLEATYFGGENFSGSIFDSRTSAMGAGLGYFQEKKGKYSLKGARLSLSSKISSQLGMGLSGKWHWGHQESGTQVDFKNVDAGLLYTLERVQVGLVIYNLFGVENPKGVEEQRGWSSGLRVNYEGKYYGSVSLSGSFGPFLSRELGFGAEYVAMEKVSVKAGYRIPVKSQRAHVISGGVSFAEKKYGIHYAVEKILQQNAKDGTQHTISLSMAM